jgi:[phosphatase 2A protein]-leucine-carboxy methyltransferase
MLDEVEELELVLEHYAVTWGVKLFDDGSNSAVWNRWGMVPKEEVTGVDLED